MTRAEALGALESPDLHVRLRAARILAHIAEPGDVRRLQDALALERVTWVQTALRQALRRFTRETERPEASNSEDIVSPEVFDQIRTIAVNETTNRIVHELAPLLGVLRMYAREEIRLFEASKTKLQIDRFQELLRALDRLSGAATAPKLAEFDLSHVIHSVVDSELPTRHVKVELAGPAPLLVVGDAALVELAIANGVRNAIEAVDELHRDKADIPPVVVNWGETERDVWVAVLDRGPGPPLGAERAFEIGNTTKKNHLGMGLATARQAAVSMSGAVSLGPRSEYGGARFELRWPKAQGSE